MLTTPRVAVVDDEPLIVRSCGKILRRHGIQVESADSGRGGLRLAEEKQFDAVLLDLRMPDMSGVEVLRRLRDRRPETVVIVITGYPSDEVRDEVRRLGAADFVAKPFTPEDLMKAISRALGRRRPAAPAAGVLAETLPVSPPAKIRTVALLGCDTVGSGIAQCVAAGGINVILREKNPECVERALEGIRESLDGQIRRWGITGSEKNAVLARIQGTTDPVEAASADLLIEALPEVPAARIAALRRFDGICPPQTIFVTTASAVSPGVIGAHLGRPDRFMGVHFAFPAHRVPVVEVVRTAATSEATERAVRGFLTALGKRVIEVRDTPGLVSARMLLPFINEAFSLVLEGVARADDVDRAMKNVCGMAMPPLEMADRMGLDEVARMLDSLFQESGDVRYRPSPLLRKLVREGRLGVKTGGGVFDYPDGERA